MADDVQGKSGVDEAIAAVAAELGGIEKSERNEEQHFNFRSIDAITAAIRPLAGKHGLTITPTRVDTTYSEVESRRGTKGFRCIAACSYRVGHTGGSYFEAQMVGEAIDFGDKATSKAVQMAYKYLVTEMFMVGSGDRDPDGTTVEEMHGGLSEDEKAQRATNRLKADVIKAAGGDKGRARALYEDVVSNLGYGFEDAIPSELHAQILADVTELASEKVEKAEVTELTAEERAELERAMKARENEEASALPFAEEVDA